MPSCAYVVVKVRLATQGHPTNDPVSVAFIRDENGRGSLQPLPPDILSRLDGASVAWFMAVREGSEYRLMDRVTDQDW